VSKVAELQSLVAAAVNAFGRVDIMVSNAGVETRTSLLDTTEQQYDRVLDINLKSAFFGTQTAAKPPGPMRRSGRFELQHPSWRRGGPCQVVQTKPQHYVAG
jgi:glucose 1-dehydrogenase